MSQGFKDWEDLGIFPLQDVEEGVPLGMRMTLVGGRVLKRPDAGEGGNSTVTEYAREDGLGTLGDIHPWTFWQTAGRDERAMGSWSMANAAIVIDLVSQRYGGGIGVQPLTRFGDDVVNDIRYRTKYPAWQDALPVPPEGMIGMLMPSTDELAPDSVMLNGDRRLVAAGVSGPGNAGTTICDMQPEGQLCMDGSNSPGQGGRHARLQGLVRVIALTSGSAPLLGGSDQNGIALNYGFSQQDGILGLGMIYGPIGAVSGGGGAGPTTGDTGQSGPITHGGGGRSSQRGPPPPGNRGRDFAGGGNVLNASGPGGPNSGTQTSAADFGSFIADPQSGYAVGFMSSGASGPIIFGCSKHHVGVDKDGHAMTSAHLSSGAYFLDTPERDGPLMFEGKFPDEVGEHQVPSLVHLSWDEKQQHDFVGGSRGGKWRWWTTVPYMQSEDDEEDDEEDEPPEGSGPSTPSTPGTPNAPSTPGGGGRGNPGSPSGPVTPGGGGGGQPGKATGPNPPTPSTPQAPTVPTGPIRLGTPPVWPRGGSSPGPIRPGEHPEPPNPPWQSPLKPKGPVTPPNSSKPSLPETPQYLLDGFYANQRPTSNFAVDPGGSLFSERNTDTTDQEPPPLPIDKTITGTKGPSGVIPKVGGSAEGRDVGLYSILHPFNTGFAAISLRPQLWIKGAPNFEHNPLLAPRLYKTEERTRPSVLTIRAWGAQNASGDWDYVKTPKQSRARGGIVNGGILIAPSEFEMEDYLGINSNADTDNPKVRTYVTFAPMVAAAFGKPTTAGIPTANSKLIHQETAAGKLHVSEIDSVGGMTDIMMMSIDSGQGYVELDGTGACRIPAGVLGKRPPTPVDGMLRVNTTDNNLEYYVAAAWRSSGSSFQDKSPVFILAQGASNYTTERFVTQWTPRAGDITAAFLNVTDTIAILAGRYWIFRIYNAASVVATIRTDVTAITANSLVSFGTLSNVSFDGSMDLRLSIQSVNDGTQPQNLLGDYLTFDVKMSVD